MTTDDKHTAAEIISEKLLNWHWAGRDAASQTIVPNLLLKEAATLITFQAKEVEALRARNHEIADGGNRKNAELQSTVARFKADFAEAEKWVADLTPDWAAEPWKSQVGKFWDMTSGNARTALTRMVQRHADQAKEISLLQGTVEWLLRKPQSGCDFKCEYARHGNPDGCLCGLAEWTAEMPTMESVSRQAKEIAALREALPSEEIWHEHISLALCMEDIPQAQKAEIHDSLWRSVKSLLPIPARSILASKENEE